MALVRIRLLQLKRELNAVGVFYVFLLLVFAVFVVAGFFKIYQSAVYAPYLAVVIVLTVLSLQLSRPDKSFVFRHLSNPVRGIAAEYILLSLPLTIPVLFTSRWPLFFVMVMAFLGIAAIRYSYIRRRLFPQLSSIIPSREFEWISGIRKNFFSVIMIYLLAIVTIWLQFVPLVLLWVLTVTIGAFYIECEPRDILLAYGTSAKRLLLQKIKRHSILLIIISLPVLIGSSIFHPWLAWVNLLFIPLQLLFLSLAIILKYAFYTPNLRLSGNNILIGIASVSIIIPFMLPLPLVMCFRYYGKAIRNLNAYLT